MLIPEGIRLGPNNTLDFGAFTVKEKIKVDGFPVMGDLYKVKTHNEITRLEKNGVMLFEAVPGAAVFGFKMDDRSVSFSTIGQGNTQITLEVLPVCEYKIYEEEVLLDRVKTGPAGKISLGLELSDKPIKILIEKAE